MPKGKRSEPAQGLVLCQVNTLEEAAELRRQLADRERELLGQTIELAENDIALAKQIEGLGHRMIEMAQHRLAQLAGTPAAGGNGRANAPRKSQAPATPTDPDPEPARAKRSGPHSTMEDAIVGVLRIDGGALAPGEIAQCLIDSHHPEADAVADGTEDAGALAKRVASRIYNSKTFESAGRGVGYRLANQPAAD